MAFMVHIIISYHEAQVDIAGLPRPGSSAYDCLVRGVAYPASER